jgi:rod shape-determining protein MreD
MSLSLYLSVPVMALLALLQTALMPHFPIFGQVPVLPFVVALAWSLIRGVNEGLVWAFVAGIFVDLFSVAPMGLSSLTFMLAVLAVSYVSRAMPESRYLLPPLLAALATLTYLFLYFIVIQLVGDGVSLLRGLSLLPLAVVHSLLILPVYWLLVAIERLARTPRVSLE